MAQFMLLIGGVDPSRRSGTPNYDPIMAQYRAWTEDMLAKRVLVESHKLKDGVGRRLGMAKDVVVDGPHVETKETIGGYYVIDVADIDAAVAWAKRCPSLAGQGGFVEVRPVEI